MRRLPDFLIIGAMKCATSTLHEQLAAQDGFFMSTPKEIYFFSDDHVYKNGIDWYAQHFTAASPSDLVGESSTHYTKLPTHPSSVDRIATHLDAPKLIYVMRHPVERVVSQYIHHWTMREVRGTLSEELRRGETLTAYSQYARQLKPYFERFGRESVLPVFLPRLKAQPQQELKRVCRFLGYQGDPTWREDLGPANTSADRMRTSMIRDLFVNAPGLSSVRRLLPQALRDRVKGLWKMKSRPQLTDKERQKLTTLFDQDLAELGEWLGVRLTCENFNELTSERALGWASSAANEQRRSPSRARDERAEVTRAI